MVLKYAYAQERVREISQHWTGNRLIIFHSYTHLNLARLFNSGDELTQDNCMWREVYTLVKEHTLPILLLITWVML